MLKVLEEARILRFPKVADGRGSLSYVEAQRHVPFEIKRVYYVNDVPGSESRGYHAHKTLYQVLIVLSGSLDVELDDGHARSSFTLSKSHEGLLLPPGYWRGLSNFASGTVLLALTSAYYDANDYIRDYNDYLSWRRQENKSTVSLTGD